MEQPQPTSLYESSTQFKHWRYSVSDLAAKRSTLNASAVANISSSYEALQPGSSSAIQFLNATEELLLVRLYITKIPQLCRAFKFPEEVEATAVSFLKRFYLNNTVMDWHPKNVMLTALFLATKTTNNPITIDAYSSRIPKTNPSDVLDLEFLLAQSLNFEFSVWHAHRSLWGLYLDLQTLEQPPDDLDDIYVKGLDFVKKSRITDLEFVYTPSQIALAAIHSLAPEKALEWAAIKGVNIEIFQAMAAQIKATIDLEGKEPNVEALREVDRRLRTCKNPDKTIGSAAYEQKKAEEDLQASEKRVNKAIAARKSMEEEDPFGGTLGHKTEDTPEPA